MGRLSMLSRTTRSFVTFANPFVLNSYTGELPPSDYLAISEDKVLQNPSFAAYRKTTTHILIKVPVGTDRSELRPTDHHFLNMAIAHDQACSIKPKNSEAALSPSEDKK